MNRAYFGSAGRASSPSLAHVFSTPTRASQNRLGHSVAPADASKRHAMFDRVAQTDARRKSQDLGFGTVAMWTEWHRPNRLRSCRPVRANGFG